jgi:hypothetical protein
VTGDCRELSHDSLSTNGVCGLKTVTLSNALHGYGLSAYQIVHFRGPLLFITRCNVCIM